MWWSWAVLGSVMVILGSATFFITSNSPASTLPRTGDAPGPAQPAASTAPTTPRNTPTTTRHTVDRSRRHTPVMASHTASPWVTTREKPTRPESPPSRRPPGRIPRTPPTISTKPAAGPRWTAPPTSRRGARLRTAWPSASPSFRAWAPSRREPRAPTTSTSPSLGRNLVRRQRGQRHLASGMGVQRQLVHLVGGEVRPTPRTSWRSGARS